MPDNKLQVHKKEGEILCVSDHEEKKNYVPNKSYTTFIEHKRKGDIPAYKHERIFSSYSELIRYFEEVRNMGICLS